MDQMDKHFCPYCGSQLVTAVKGVRTKYVCDKCDSDPRRSAKVKALIDGPALQLPEEV
jgi:DNA-directed RNA polymerase subunit M/transcription elongation factor TFIIS